MEIRREVMKFAEAMERKLQENDYKGGWTGCLLDYLMIRTVEELGEVIACHSDSDSAKDLKFLDEAADVANYLMMLCDVRGHLGTEPRAILTDERYMMERSR